MLALPPPVTRLAAASAACLAISLCLAAPARAQADLTVSLDAPERARPGQDLGGALAVVVANRGNRTAPGTASRGRDGYMVDLFLTRGAIPSGFASYSDRYADGVLLRGGRASNTRDLRPGSRAGYRIGGVLPADTPAGSYRLCARVDPGAKVPEADEANNLACRPLQVVGTGTLAERLGRPQVLEIEPERATPPAVEPPHPAGGGTTRTVLADGTIELRHPDGRIQRLRPDGKIETELPNGQVTVPYALQVQQADLPALPDELSPWGQFLADRLIGILRNVLSEAEFAAYQQTEQGKDYYELVDWRLRSIAFLTSAE